MQSAAQGIARSSRPPGRFAGADALRRRLRWRISKSSMPSAPRSRPNAPACQSRRPADLTTSVALIKALGGGWRRASDGAVVAQR